MREVQLNLNTGVLYMDFANFANFAFLQYTIQLLAVRNLIQTAT